MASKTYSPAQVADPTSENHLIRLYPNQDLRLVLSQDSEDLQVFLTSEFLRLSREEDDKKGNRVYHFVQQYDLTEWADVSSAYLGEVAILRRDRIASICVMLEGQNPHNRNMITTVNPIGSQIKIEPHQVLEVVVFDCDDHVTNAWDYEIHVGDDNQGVQYEYIGREVVYPTVQYKTYVDDDDLHDMTLVLPRATKDVPKREYHFYFRCSYETLLRLQSGANGTFDGGKVCFFPKLEGQPEVNQQFKFVLNLSMNVRDRNRGKMFDTLFFPQKFHIVSTPECLRSAASERVIYPKRESNKKVISKTTYSKPSRPSTYTHTHTSKTTYNNVWRSSIQVPNIVLKPKRTQSIDAGCKVAYCVRTNKKKRKKKRKKNRR